MTQYLDPTLFTDAAIPDETKQLNAGIIALTKDMANWWEVGAQKVRDARAAGTSRVSGAGEIRSRQVDRNRWTGGQAEAAGDRARKVARRLSPHSWRGPRLARGGGSAE